MPATSPPTTASLSRFSPTPAAPLIRPFHPPDLHPPSARPPPHPPPPRGARLPLQGVPRPRARQGWRTLLPSQGRGRFPEDPSRLISVITYSHSRGAFHRDLKPENLLLDDADSSSTAMQGLSRLRYFPPSTRFPQAAARPSMRGPRMRWTTTLHARFVHAVELLGGHESMISTNYID
ncbi:hypothetical protein Cni_G10355 [Canna indica]|uniref:Protein kinase domain-containing protein n=1 Tax=Canna indica TaxID=4628 RepID=A0AAQ3K434_9LILI|nr:hypothetical protein Cni_G10355 [Canna indica]